jgi:hypothetical protein
LKILALVKSAFELANSNRQFLAKSLRQLVDLELGHEPEILDASEVLEFTRATAFDLLSYIEQLRMTKSIRSKKRLMPLIVKAINLLLKMNIKVTESEENHDRTLMVIRNACVHCNTYRNILIVSVQRIIDYMLGNDKEQNWLELSTQIFDDFISDLKEIKRAEGEYKESIQTSISSNLESFVNIKQNCNPEIESHKSALAKMKVAFEHGERLKDFLTEEQLKIIKRELAKPKSETAKDTTDLEKMIPTPDEMIMPEIDFVASEFYETLSEKQKKNFVLLRRFFFYATCGKALMDQAQHLKEFRKSSDVMPMKKFIFKESHIVEAKIASRVAMFAYTDQEWDRDLFNIKWRKKALDEIKNEFFNVLGGIELQAIRDTELVQRREAKDFVEKVIGMSIGRLSFALIAFFYFSKQSI